MEKRVPKKWIVALAVALVAGLAATLFNPWKPKGLPVGRALSWGPGGGEGIDYLTVGLATITSFELFSVKEDLVVESAAPVRIARGLKLMDARFNYVFRKRDGHGVNGGPGYYCTHWPPPGLGPTYRAAGLQLNKGDQVYLNFYIRVEEPGDWQAEGVRVIYRQGDRRFRAVNPDDTLTLHAFEKEEQLPAVHCNPDLKSIWTGQPYPGEPFVLRPGHPSTNKEE